VTLAQARGNIGAEVIYKPCDLCSWGREKGVITSVSAVHVFVLYAGGGPKATRPGDLTLARHDAVVTT